MWSHRDPAMRKVAGSDWIVVENVDTNIDNKARRIVVENLEPYIDDKALYDMFSLFGNILSCKVRERAVSNCPFLAVCLSQRCVRTELAKLASGGVSARLCATLHVALHTQPGTGGQAGGRG